MQLAIISFCFSADESYTGPSPAGGPVVPGTPFEIGAPHLTFGPPVAAYIQYCILKMWPPFWFWAPPFGFCPPCCYILAPGMELHTEGGWLKICAAMTS